MSKGQKFEEGYVEGGVKSERDVPSAEAPPRGLIEVSLADAGVAVPVRPKEGVVYGFQEAAENSK